MKRNSSLEIASAAAAGGKAASPEHKRFQTLLAKIDKARERLQAWQQQLPLFAQMHEAQAVPVLAQLAAERRAWALGLEQLLLNRRWSKADTRTLTRMLCDLSGSLVESTDPPDAEMKALYNRWADISFDEEEEEHLALMKAMLEEVGGVDLGEDAVASEEELMQRAHANMAQDHEQRQSAARSGTRPPPRKNKTAAQKRAEEDEARISQTVREVYRKLAAALHPDRVAPDATLAERQRSTDLMQRANSAYEAGDLLALLTLQLQIEQVDIAHAASIAAAQVKHFNKVLAEQLRELEAEIDGRQHAFCASYGLMVQQRIDPAQLGLLMKDQLRALNIAMLRLQQERKLLSGEPVQAKRFLKHLRAEQQFEDRMDDLLF